MDIGKMWANFWQYGYLVQRTLGSWGWFLSNRRMNIAPILGNLHHTPLHLKGSFILTSVELQRRLWINETRRKFQRWIKNLNLITWSGNWPQPHIFLCLLHRFSCYHSNQGFLWRFGRSRRSSFAGTAARTDSCSLPRPLCDRFRRWSVG